MESRDRSNRAPSGPHKTRQAPSQRARSTDPARLAAFDVVREVDASDAYANLLLPAMLRARHIRGRDAAFATDLTYGTLRMRGFYDAVIAHATSRPLAEIDAAVLDALRLGVHQLLNMRVPAHAAVSETVGLARDRVGNGPAHFVNAVLRTVSETPMDGWLQRIVPADEGDVIGQLAVTKSHPAWIVRAFREALVINKRDAAELGALLDADNTAPKLTLIARPRGTTQGALINELKGEPTPTRWSSYGVRWSGGDPGAISLVREGKAAVQDEGSQLVAEALASTPLEGSDARWLDMCAGPGGKAALLAGLAAERGAMLVANEVQSHRAQLVKDSVGFLDDATVSVWTDDGRDIGTTHPNFFDRVLVDAPCTGLGALRRRPESRWRRTPSDLAALGSLQRDLLRSALNAVRPGGVVAYVTCSPHIAETGLVVSDVTRKREDVTALNAVDAIQHVAATNVPDLGGGPYVQLWPHLHDTDGMFLALIRKNG